MRRTVCALLAVLLLLSGCGSEETRFYNSFYRMDQFMTIQLWGSDNTDVAKELSKILNSLEETYAPTAESPSRQTALSDLAHALSQRTGGAYSPDLYALKELWGFPTHKYEIPTQDQIGLALQDRRQDLTDLLTGYAAEKCVAYLKEQPVDRAFLELGDTVQTYGSKPDGTPWSVNIHSPQGTGPIGTVEVTGTAAVSTVGSYQYWFELEGQCYYPLLDPATGCPADAGLASVTVISDSGTTSKGLATALFVLGLEEGTRLWQESSDFEAVFILTDGTIHATQDSGFTGSAHDIIARAQK